LSGTFELSGDTTVVLKMIPYSTSVTESKGLNKIRLWPNPASTHINIELPDDCTDCTAQILNMQGALMKTFECSNGNKLELQINDIPSGLLLLKITGQNIQTNQVFLKR
jgi:hypothetical protein